MAEVDVEVLVLVLHRPADCFEGRPACRCLSTKSVWTADGEVLVRPFCMRATCRLS